MRRERGRLARAREVNRYGDFSTLSPDGRWLTFDRPRTEYFNSLFLVNLATGKTRLLGETNGNERWSPVGARLAVSQRRGFFLIDAASGKRTRLLANRVTSFDFTPDGSSIVLAEGKRVEGTSEERSDLFLLRVPNRRLERLTRDHHSKNPLVGPAAIVYVRFGNAYLVDELWLMRKDGSAKRLLARCCETKRYGTQTAAYQVSSRSRSRSTAHICSCARNSREAVTRWRSTSRTAGAMPSRSCESSAARRQPN